MSSVIMFYPLRSQSGIAGQHLLLGPLRVCPALHDAEVCTHLRIENLEVPSAGWLTSGAASRITIC